MQIIEGSLIGVRSARLSFHHPTKPVSITLFPMIHVGEAEFYARAYEDAFAHDVVLVEGVRSPVSKRVTRSYRWMLGSNTLGLTLQPPPPTDSGATVVLADLSGPEFEAEWRKVALWLRLAVYVLAAGIGLWARFNMTRERIAKMVSLDDAPSLRELTPSPEAGALTAVILDARDRRLLEMLRKSIDADDPGPRTLAIVYGARHMRAVIRELSRNQGYHVGTPEWMTVFST